jgi:predicted dehydrogenase
MHRRHALRTLGIGGVTAPWLSSLAGERIIPKVYALPSFEATPGPSRTIKAIVLGAGARGNTYGDYALSFPTHLDIVGVAEPIPVRRERFSMKHEIPPERQYTTWEHVFDHPRFADVVIITTPDHLHHGPAMQALAMGYDLLLEKPIAQSWRECKEILDQQKAYDRIVAVCHVLRYAPYFQKVKELMDSGFFGRVVSVQHFEPVEHAHMAHSFVRGNWRNAEESNPMILQKSCHDMDILRWWIGRRCTHISSFGHLTWFKEMHAPPGSTARCTDGCVVEAECPYSALRIYHRNRHYTYVFDLPDTEPHREEAILRNLREGPYGRCVYRCDNTVVDHQVCAMQFEDEITATFQMEAFTHDHGRKTRVMGSMGDLVGDGDQMYLANFSTGTVESWHIADHASMDSGHGGGDWRLVRDFLNAVEHHDVSLLTSNLDASMDSHLMCFMAEESRKDLQTKKILY